MTRSLLGAVVALSCLAPTAAARLGQPKLLGRPDHLALSLSAVNLPDPAAPAPPSEVRMTAETEVLLNGRGCKFTDVPATAAVTRMVLAADGRTVVIIEFRSPE